MTQSSQPRQTLTRESFLLLLRGVLNLRQERSEIRFARQAAQRWLEVYPGDLEVRFMLSLALLAEAGQDTDKTRQAMALLDEVCRQDPEYVEAQSVRVQMAQIYTQDDVSLAEGNLFALVGEEATFIRSYALPAPDWSRALWQARQAMAHAQIGDAETLLQKALDSTAQLDVPLLGLTHLQILRSQLEKDGDGNTFALNSMAEFYHQRWQDCLPISLILAASLMDGGESERGVALLHQGAGRDIAGQTAQRLWGKNHPYRSLWLDAPTLDLDIPMPAAVAALLGWNQLPGTTLFTAPEAAQEPPIQSIPAPDEPLIGETQDQSVLTDEVLQELDKIAHSLKQPHLARSDGRFPVYIAWSSRQGLIQQYGQAGFEALDRALQELVQAVGKRAGWNAHLLYADDPRSAAALGIKPVSARDAWQLKLSLAALDQALGKRGMMIGALLIVGGTEIIPFHKLPNPVDDPDIDVPSDNPYATRDENYFVPDWQVGRVCAGTGRDAQVLVDMLARMLERHQQQPLKEKPWRVRFLDALLGMISPAQRRRKSSLGCTAAIWKEASVAVFKPIGGAEDLFVSPPFDADGFANGSLVPARLGYFNLHGVEDAPEWFGQRDPRQALGRNVQEWLAEDDYPVALRPSNLHGNEDVPEFIFTEACYGAHSIGKEVDEAMSLKFLSLGSQGLVGSTCTAYGSVTTPLSAADMLGYTYWQYLKDGLTAGEALRRAKVDLAAEMHQKQGFLDGEDQKTLIQFVLYGDPLARLDSSQPKRRSAQELARPRQALAVKTVQEQPQAGASQALTSDALDAIKGAVAKYLPGMEDAQMSLSEMYPELPVQPTKRLNGKPAAKLYAAESLPRRVVTLHKRVAGKSITHQVVARFTIDEDGEVLKMTVSR